MAFPGTLPLTATTSVSTPPTPFADRETLEAELRALESEVGDIETLKGIATWRPGGMCRTVQSPPSPWKPMFGGKLFS